MSEHSNEFWGLVNHDLWELDSHYPDMKARTPGFSEQDYLSIRRLATNCIGRAFDNEPAFAAATAALLLANVRLTMVAFKSDEIDDVLQDTPKMLIKTGLQYCHEFPGVGKRTGITDIEEPLLDNIGKMELYLDDRKRMHTAFPRGAQSFDKDEKEKMFLKELVNSCMPCHDTINLNPENRQRFWDSSNKHALEGYTENFKFVRDVLEYVLVELSPGESDAA